MDTNNSRFIITNTQGDLVCETEIHFLDRAIRCAEGIAGLDPENAFKVKEWNQITLRHELVAVVLCDNDAVRVLYRK